MDLKSSKKPVVRSATFESTFSAASEECQWIVEQMQRSDYGKEDVFAVHLALEEVFTNSVKHGNRMDTAKGVKVEYSVWSDKVQIRVIDEGDGFNPDQVPDPRSKENLYRTEGRGLLLIQSYMDKVEFNEQGNEVFLLKFKGKEAELETSGT